MIVKSTNKMTHCSKFDENVTIKVEEDEMSRVFTFPEQLGADSKNNLQAIIKTEDDETYDAIKSEEVPICFELPAGEISSPNHEVTTEFRCYLCTTATYLESLDALDEHLAAAHPEDTNYYCRECNSFVETKLNYNQHLLQHDTDARLCASDEPSHSRSSGDDSKLHDREKMLLPANKLELHGSSENGKQFMTSECQESSGIGDGDGDGESYVHRAIKTEEVHIYSELSDERNLKLMDENVPYIAANDFRCYLCTELTVYQDRSSLHQHLRAGHQQQKSYHCDECCKSLPGITAFNKHLKLHDTKTRPYKCNFCPLRYTTSYHKRRHAAVVHQVDNGLAVRRLKKKQRSDFSCNLCAPSIELKDKESLLEHLKKSHSMQKSFRCYECHKNYKHITPFNKHLGQHDVSIRPHKCAICSLRFIKAYHKEQHEADMHQLDNRKNKCKKNLMRRKRNRIQIRCYLCTTFELFADKESLRAHLGTAHPMQKSYHCDECDKFLPSKISFNQHLGFHDASIRPYKCGACPLRFFKAHYQKRHETDIHGLEWGERKSRFKKLVKLENNRLELRSYKFCYFCYLCNPSTMLQDEESLHKHLDSVHPMQESYCCEECHKSMQSKVDFNKHLKRHDASLRPYKCSVCPRRFINNFNKSLHEAKVHQLDNGRTKCYPSIRLNTTNTQKCKTRFRCYLCPTLTTLEDKESLHEHLQSSHPMQKTYRCDECDKSVKKITVFNRHLGRHDESTRVTHKRQHEADIHQVNNGRAARYRVRKRSTCPICKKRVVFVSGASKCQSCTKKGYDEETLDQHLISSSDSS